MDLMGLVIVAMVGEAVWESFKMVWQQGKLNKDRLGALIVGLVISFSTGLDLLTLVGVPTTKIPFLGVFLTGVLISRGSNFMHDILSSMDNVHKNIKNNNK